MSDEIDPLEQALNRVLPELRFDGHALADAIQLLRDLVPVNIHVNWRMLEVCGIDRDARVTVSLAGATFAQALETILYDVGGGMIRLGHRAYDGIITISSYEDLASQVITRVYDVRDLVADRDDGQQSGGSPEKEAARVSEIASLLFQAIAPESWDANGGHGSIGRMNRTLVVVQTPEHHRQIVRLLRQLGDSSGIPSASMALWTTDGSSAPKPNESGMDSTPGKSGSRVESAAQPDGPIPPKSLRYNGRLIDTIEPTPWKLLSLLWQEPRRVEVARAEQQVWGGESESDARLKSAITKINKALTEVGCTLSVRKSGDWLTLE